MKTLTSSLSVLEISMLSLSFLQNRIKARQISRRVTENFEENTQRFNLFCIKCRECDLYTKQLMKRRIRRDKSRIVITLTNKWEDIYIPCLDFDFCSCGFDLRSSKRWISSLYRDRDQIKLFCAFWIEGFKWTPRKKERKKTAGPANQPKNLFWNFSFLFLKTLKSEEQISVQFFLGFYYVGCSLLWRLCAEKTIKWFKYGRE